MAISDSMLMYEDCFDLFDRALESEEGVGARMDDEGAAGQFRLRMHNARQLHRRQNKEAYPLDHPEYGRSVYDRLVVSVKFFDGAWWIYVSPRRTPMIIKELRDGIPTD